jgi:hypothetical protein
MMVLLNAFWVEVLNMLNKYQSTTKAWRDKSIIPKDFRGDIVLVWTTRIEGKGKLEPNWEGPYISTKKTLPNSYRLKS